jgi:acyl-CoA reductase-like NAD-dependent aldehyde dehydrogenase
VKHYCAELGGNCPVLVFADCDLAEAVDGVAFGAFVAAGQTCVSAKRILVQDGTPPDKGKGRGGGRGGQACTRKKTASRPRAIFAMPRERVRGDFVAVRPYLKRALSVRTDIYDAFVSALVAKANSLRLGDPMDLNTHMGPLVSAQQLHILERQVQRAG